MKSNVTCTQSKEPSLLLGVCSFGCPLAQGEQHSLIEDVGDVIGRKAAVFGLSGGCEGGGGGGGGDEKGVPHLRGKGTYTGAYTYCHQGYGKIIITCIQYCPVLCNVRMYILYIWLGENHNKRVNESKVNVRCYHSSDDWPLHTSCTDLKQYTKP